jgi:hypothetical protein
LELRSLKAAAVWAAQEPVQAALREQADLLARAAGRVALAAAATSIPIAVDKGRQAHRAPKIPRYLARMSKPDRAKDIKGGGPRFGLGS